MKIKTLKFILIITVVLPLVFFSKKIIEGEGELSGGIVINDTSLNKNVNDIQVEINSLERGPSDKLYSDTYKSIKNKIDEWYKEELFSQSTRANKQYRMDLSNNLFTAYALHFVNYTEKKFMSGTCHDLDYKTIHSAAIELSRSPFLRKGDDFDLKLNEIQTTTSKYFEIRNFINSCNNYSFIYFGMDVNFPVEDDLVKVRRARTYLDRKMENTNINNCSNLKAVLAQIPENLFNAHFDYLKAKIQKNSDLFAEFKYQSDYSNNIYSPLKRQIEKLYTEGYGMKESYVDYKYGLLELLLNTDNKKAIEYFRNLEQ